MRRFVACLAVLCLISGVVIGCRNPCCHDHGLQDCWYLDPCVTRAPWAMPEPPPGVPVSVSPTPVLNGSLPTPLPVAPKEKQKL